MFTISHHTFGPFTEIKMENTGTGEYVTVIPECGGAVNQHFLSKGNKLVKVLKGFDNPHEWESKGIKDYYGVKLFPFPGRINNGTYQHEGNVYQLDTNDTKLQHALHGLVFNQTFALLNTQETEDFAQITLAHKSNGSAKNYPFAHQIQITYRLDKNGFECRSSIRNNDRRKMPVGDGWHPYFNVSTNADAMHLQVSSDEILEHDVALIPTGKTMTVNKYVQLSQIGDDPLFYCFKLNGGEAAHTTVLYDPETDVRINVRQQTGFRKYNYLQLYVPPDRSAIAIEPYTCPSDAFNSGIGLIELNPDEDFSLSFGISVQ